MIRPCAATLIAMIGFFGVLRDDSLADGCATKLPAGPAYSGLTQCIKLSATGFPNLAAYSTARSNINTMGCDQSGGPGFDWPKLQTSDCSPTGTPTTINVANRAPEMNCQGGTSYCPAVQEGKTITIYKFYGPAPGNTPVPGMGTNPTPGETSLLALILTHEFGHLLGLDHDACTNGIMNTPVTLQKSIHGDECAGIDSNFRYAPEGTDSGAGCPWTTGCTISPIVVSIDGGPYVLTGLPGGVLFDLDATGDLDQCAWTEGGRALALLARDVNGNGEIDSGEELVGSQMRRPDGSVAENGFEALGDYDDNHDQLIDARDTVWSALLLWTDWNHDGFSQEAEIAPVANSRVAAISLDYHRSAVVDQYGNEFRYKSKATMTDSSGDVYTQRIYDIFFLIDR